MSITTCCTIPEGPATITPRMAAHWLEHHNKANRNISKHIVAKYADAMRQGRWLLTHQGVAFDDLGYLLDGQHRLAAIVAANVSIEMHVSVGLSRETFAVLDTGYKRSAGHLIDHPHRKIIASAARIIGPVTGTLASKNVLGGLYAGSADNDQILAVVEAWPELADYTKPVVRCYQNTGISCPPHLAIIAMAARTRHRDRIPSWFDGLIEGVNLGPSDARRLLAKRFTAQRDRRLLNGGNGRVPAYHLIAKAWNAHALDKPIGTLRYRDVEEPPDIVS